MPGDERETKQYSLEERRYRGDDGEIHYHTNTYMEQHAGRPQGDASGEERGGEGPGGERRAAEESEESGGLAKGLLAAAVVVGRESASRGDDLPEAGGLQARRPGQNGAEGGSTLS